MHQTLTQKVLFGSVIVLILTALAAGVTSTSFWATRDAAYKLTTVTVPYVQHSERFEAHVFRAITEALAFERTRNPEFRHEAQEELEYASENLQSLARLSAARAPDLGGTTLQLNREEVLDELATQINMLLDGVVANDGPAVEVTLRRLKLAEDAIEVLEQDVTTLMTNDLTQSIDATTGAIQLGSISLLIGFGLIALAIIIAVSLLQHQIVRPIRELARMAGKVAQGDLAPSIQQSGMAEIGDLQRAFAQMVHDLQAQQDAFARRVVAEQARVAAEEANRAKSVFLSAMSHELRTPLTAILGYTELLQRELETCDRRTIRADLGNIHAASRHLLALINNLLDLSKIESGQAVVQWDTVAVPAVAQEVADSMRPLIQQRGNTLQLQCAPEVGPLRTDRTKLQQILINVLGNATKFTERGTIKLQIHCEGPPDALAMVFRISDTGIGMTAAQLMRIFRPYTQADATIAQRYGGSGLGLAVTRRLCSMLHGTIDAESTPGQGSTFTIRLPMDGEAAASGLETPAQPPTDAPPIAKPSTVVPPLVLVVGAAAAQPSSTVLALEAAGMEIVTAASGREGGTLAIDIRPEAIVLERDLPELDEWHLRRAITAEPTLTDTPLIIMDALVTTPVLGQAAPQLHEQSANLDDTLVQIVQQRIGHTPYQQRGPQPS